MLADIIPDHRKNVKEFVTKEGNKVVGQVTLEQVQCVFSISCLYSPVNDIYVYQHQLLGWN